MTRLSTRAIALALLSLAIIALIAGVAVSNERPPVAQAPSIPNTTDTATGERVQTQSHTSAQQTYIVTATTAAAINTTTLSRYGGVGTRVDARIELTTSPSNKTTIENISWVSDVRPVIRAHTAETPGSSNGSSLGVSKIHEKGITGDGVRVGVIDVGFESTNPTIRDNVVDTRSFTNSETPKRHGTSVAEIITQTAPESDLYLASVTNDIQTEAAFGYLQDQNVDIIVSSTGFLSPNDDGDHFLTDDVISARQDGILFVNSAGNLGQTHWEGEFRSTDGDDKHEWTQSGDERNCLPNCQTEYGGELDVYIRWGSENDNSRYRAVLYNPVADQIIARTNTQRATESNRYAALVTDIQTQPVSLIIQHTAGPADDTIEVSVNSKTLSGMERNVPESSLVAPADVPETFSIAAYEVSASRVAPYSSRGPTDTGQQGIDVTGYTNIGVENGLYGVTPFRFSGTSASAPYVGGVAALVEQADSGNPSPATLATTLRSASDDIRVPGDDTVSGSGVINGDNDHHTNSECQWVCFRKHKLYPTGAIG